jgi:hypothetical protein
MTATEEKAEQVLDAFLAVIKKCDSENQPSKDLVRGTLDSLEALRKIRSGKTK